MTDFSLEDLAAIVSARARSNDEKSYTRQLLGKGMAKCTQKLGEEAVETVIAAMAGDKAGVRDEAADLLYHLMVVLEASGVPLDDVMEELARRTGQTGLEEKAARPQ